MEKQNVQDIDQLNDRLYALELAFMAMAKSLHQSKALDLLHLVGALQDFSAQLRRDAANYPADSPENLDPVAQWLDQLRETVWALQDCVEE